MFESLSNKLGGVFSRLRGKGVLKEADVDEVMREIRVALLEADVALPVVREFIEKVRGKAVGENVIKGVNPAHQVVKIVSDAMTEMLGSETQDLAFASPPCAYLMVGLQGSGKTTSTAKIAKFLTAKHRKKVLMASLDIARRALDTARKEGYDVVMLDTAGRLSIDEDLMAEAAAVRDVAQPVETLLVVDAMTGQDAVNTAKAFNEKIGVTGIMLTRVDGDARGGAAMSMKAVTGKPVKLIGTGEKWDAIEQFHPDRIASRILGMGDVVSLVEKAVETVDREQAEKLAAKFKKRQFDFNDLLTQLQQMKKMGGVGSLMKMLPGLGNMAAQLENANVDETILKKQEAIILSMTKKERENPDLLNANRKKRIAAGSGTTVPEINRLVKQLLQMQTVMKRMKKMGMGKMMGMMKGLMGSHDADMLMKSMDPDMLAGDMAKLTPGDILGDNPFLKGKR